mgnify:CR=1 FL=1
MRRRPYGNGIVFTQNLARDLVDLGDEFHLVAKELKAQGMLGIRGEHVDYVPSHAKRAARQVEVVTVVLDVDERMDELIAFERRLLVHVRREAGIIFWRADAVDARDTCHNDHIAPAQQLGCRLMAEHLTSSLIEASFSIYVSDWGTYASAGNNRSRRRNTQRRYGERTRAAHSRAGPQAFYSAP